MIEDGKVLRRKNQHQESLWLRDFETIEVRSQCWLRGGSKRKPQKKIKLESDTTRELIKAPQSVLDATDASEGKLLPTETSKAISKLFTRANERQALICNNDQKLRIRLP